MKKFVFAVVLFLLPAAAAAQTSLLADVQAVRSTYPSTVSPAQLGELLNRVAWQHRDEGWGLLSKPGGNSCPAPSGAAIACDILFHRPSATHFDVLASAGDPGGSIPSWQSDGPMDVARWVAPTDPGGAPPPPPVPTPTPTPTVDMTDVIAKLEAIEDLQRQELAAINAASAANVAKLDELKVAVIKAASKLTTLLPLILGGGGGLAGILGGIKK